jgi:hypothetical protein
MRDDTIVNSILYHQILFMCTIDQKITLRMLLEQWPLTSGSALLNLLDFDSCTGPIENR